MQTVVTLVIHQPSMEYVRQWYDAGMKYERVGGKIRFRLPLDFDDYSRIHTLVEQGKIHLAERYKRIELTKKELDEHPFFEMGDEHMLLFPEEYNPVAPGCPHCGFGKRLPDKLRLPVGQLKKNRLSIIGMSALRVLFAYDRPLRLGGVQFRIWESDPAWLRRLSQMSFRLSEWARWAYSMAITWLSALKERAWILCLRARFSTILSGIHLAICARTVILCFFGFMASPVVAWSASIKMS